MKPRGLKSTSVVPAVIGMMSLLLLNMGVFSGGARMQNDRLTSMMQITALSETIMSLEREVVDANRFLALTSDDLLGGRPDRDRAQFRAAFSDRIALIRGLAQQTAAYSDEVQLEAGVAMAARVGELLDSWTSFSAYLDDDLTKGTMELILVSDPLAADLIGTAIPNLLRSAIQLREESQSAYERIAQFSQIILSAVFLSSLVAVVILLAHIFKSQGIRDELEADLRDMMTKAQDASLAKSRFLSNMSHELRTPMNGVIGMANLLSLRQVPAEEKRMLGVLKDSADAALRLINDILDFEAMEAEKLSLEETVFSVEGMLASIQEQAEALLGDKPVAFALIKDSPLPEELIGDEERLIQIIMNLVSNGIKFTDSGFVHVHVNWDTVEEMTIAVQDTGMGIDKRDFKVLFEAFKQGDDSGRRRFGGTGLGLAVASQLATIMDGRISVESELGTGSTFTFAVPLSLPPSESREKLRQSAVNTSVRSDEHQSIGSLHQNQEDPAPLILCVDGSEINLEIARFVLEEAGFACETAATGEDAIRIAKREPVTMVMMDCHLPDMECREAAKKIRAYRPGLPIYGMADEDKSADRSTYGRRGMQGVISKPLSPKSVAKVVREAHDLPAARPEEEELMLAERLS